VTVPAVSTRPPVAGVGGQQPGEHARPQPQQPGPDHRLSGPQPGITTAQRPGSLGGQPAYLSGLLLRERGEEPPFSPSGAEGTCSPATDLASQIRSFTSAICSLIAVKSRCRATSARTLPTSPGASCRPTVLRLPADRVHKNRGP
jgi:hypothetical protein